MKEERRKREIEQQKKQLQNLSVSKPTVNLDDLFSKQLPEVPGPSRPTPPPGPQTSASSAGGETGSNQSTITGLTGSGGDGGSDSGGREMATPEPQPDTGELSAVNQRYLVAIG